LTIREKEALWRKQVTLHLFQFFLLITDDREGLIVNSKIYLV